MIDALDRRFTRLDPASEDRFIKRLQIVCGDKPVELQRHAGHFDHPTVIAQRFIKFFFAGDLFSDVELPADLGQGIKQRNVVPARRRVNGKCETRRACADDGQAFLMFSRNYRHFGFVTGAWIHQARGDFTHEDLIQTGLVAADTGVDLIRPP